MENQRIPDIPRDVPLFGILVPALCLGIIFVGSEVVGLTFGNIIFGLTVLMAVPWIIVAGWGRQLRAASPMNELLFRSGSRFAQDGRTDAVEYQLPLLSRILVVFTGIVLWGWVIVLIQLALP